MSDMSINEVIAQMRALAARAGHEVDVPEDKNGVTFSGTLKNAIDKVNDVQMESGRLKKAFEEGDPNVSLAQVMVASQKSSIAFQGTLHVRNKIVEAYKDIMNMPI